MALLLGIDAGSTVTKSVLFDLDGRIVASASTRVPLSYPHPQHVERDQDALWAAVVSTVREALDHAGADGADVLAVGVTSHGDGVYLLDESGRPTRPGIMSLDTRALDIVQRWDATGVADAALELTGQRPWPSAPVALLAWLSEHEPEVMERTAWALPAKDMLKHRLTGLVGTEPTEASLSFTNVRSQVYDDEVTALFGHPELGALLAPVTPCISVFATLTPQAAAETGLRAGTPVAAGAHDVDCSALGTGVVAPGIASVVAGSFSINQVVSTSPVVGDGWHTRNFVLDQHWMSMSISPTSSANLEWFTRQLCADDLERGVRAGDPYGFVEHEVAAVLDDPSDVVFLPFLYGSPLPHDASAVFLGLRAWHSRGHMLRAVMEGIALTHRLHVDKLATAFPVERVRLTGGASKSAVWSQIFADALDRPIEVTDAQESGALGVALLAGVASGAYDSLADAVDRAVRVRQRFEPTTTGSARLSSAYRVFEDALTDLAPLWRKQQ